MTRTRNMSDLLDSSGDVKSGALDNVPASDNASALTTGTLPDGRFPATLPAVSGANLTGINTDLSGDSSPQLGGVLDTNGNNIEFPDSSGAEVNRLKFGAGDDMHVYHDGTDNHIDFTGTLNLSDTSGNLVAKFVENAAINDRGIEFYHSHSNNRVMDITTSGVNITGSMISDGGRVDGDFTFSGNSYDVLWDESLDTLHVKENAKVGFGSLGVELSITNNGTATLVSAFQDDLIFNSQSSTADILIKSNNNTEDMAKFIPDGAVELYHNNAKKIETTSTGVNVTGTAETDGVSVGGSTKWEIELSGNDLIFKYNGTAKIKFASDGEIVTVDDVTAFGTV